MGEWKPLEYHGVTKGGKQPIEYQIWAAIKQRCFNKKHPKYKNYGGRGITMHPAWAESYMAFFEHVGPRTSDQHTLDRIDNDGSYVPGNVRWATRTEQMRNTRVTRMILFEGKMTPLPEVAERIGMSRKRLQARLDSGMSVEEAIWRPVERGSLYYEWRGEKHSLSTWARKLKKGYHGLYYAIVVKGTPIEEAFTS